MQGFHGFIIGMKNNRVQIDRLKYDQSEMDPKEKVSDRMIALAKTRNLLDVKITDMGYLREKTFDFLDNVDWPNRGKQNEDVIYDTIYDLAYLLMEYKR